MSSVLFIFTITYCFIFLTLSAQFTYKQERGLINFYDPNYVKDPQAFTGRKSRRDSYKSNLTVTTLHPWGNNVTISVFYVNKRTGSDLIVKIRCCEVYNQFWMEEFLYAYILKERKKMCPFPAATYSVINVELPPKHYPLPLPKGEAQVIFVVELTDSKHVILKFSLKIKA